MIRGIRSLRFWDSLLLSAGFLCVLGSVGGSAAQSNSAGTVVTEIETIDGLLRDGLWTEAVQRAQALWERHSESVHAWQILERLGLALHRRGEPEAALPYFELAIQLMPQEPSLHLNLASALMAEGRRGRAFSEYQQAVTLDPSSWRARIDYGQALLDFQMLAQARVQLLAAEESCQGCPEVDRVLARLHLAEQDFAGAIPYLERNYQANSDSLSRRNLATALQHAGQAERLLGLLEPFWPAKLSTAERIMVLEADRRQGNHQRAAAAVLQLQAGQPLDDSPLFWGIVSLACQEADLDEEALVAVDHAICLDPRNATYRNNRVVILTRQGRHAEAAAEWARVLELAPEMESGQH